MIKRIISRFSRLQKVNTSDNGISAKSAGQYSQNINMNFLEAHKVFYSFIDYVAAGKYQLYGSEKSLPFYCEDWHDILIAAYQIVLSHYIYWRLWDKAFLDNVFMLLTSLKTNLIEDELSSQLLRATELFSQYGDKTDAISVSKIKEANGIFSKWNAQIAEIMQQPSGHDDVLEVFKKMQKYYCDVSCPKLQKGIPEPEVRKDYVQHLYFGCDLEYEPDFLNYFIPLEEMRKHANPGDFFYPYRDEIFRRQI